MAHLPNPQRSLAAARVAEFIAMPIGRRELRLAPAGMASTKSQIRGGGRSGSIEPWAAPSETKLTASLSTSSRTDSNCGKTAAERLKHLSAHRVSQSLFFDLSQSCAFGQQSDAAPAACFEYPADVEPWASAVARGGMASDAATMAINRALKTLIGADYQFNRAAVKSRLGEATRIPLCVISGPPHRRALKRQKQTSLGRTRFEHGFLGGPAFKFCVL
jgi:hypothetical protein